eukprot:3529010-Prymnesium_polylepis.1
MGTGGACGNGEARTQHREGGTQRWGGMAALGKLRAVGRHAGGGVRRHAGSREMLQAAGREALSGGEVRKRRRVGVCRG